VLLASSAAFAEAPNAAPSASDAPAPSTPPAANATPAATSAPPPGALPTGSLPTDAPSDPLASAVPPPSLVSTDAPLPLVWKWSTFSTADYAISLTGGALTLATAIIHPVARHSLGGGILFDNAVRNALRAKTLPDRYIFRDASDVGLSLSVSWPFVADALTEAWWYRGSRESAQEMALIDLETFAISGALQGVTNVFVSRERPYGQDCGTADLPSNAIDCTASNHYRSFFSGHATFSFTGAALICEHHFENDLLGSPWDALSCVGGYAVAATTSTFRVVSDVHYASDVLTGALVGTLVGYGVPWLHYRNKRARTTTLGMELHLVPSPGGLGVLGIF
jgi:membrane-associated phospholipid phosphatase